MGTSYLGIPLLRLVIIIGMSLLLKAFIRGKVRDALMPWCFAGMLAHFNLVPFFPGVTHFGLLCLYFLEMAFLLDGMNLNYLRHNKVMACFLCFWFYLTITAFWSEDVYFAFTMWLNALFELTLVGYYAGMWVMRTPNGLARLLKPCAIVGLLSFYGYAKSGFAFAELDHNGRGLIDESFTEQELGNNVNGIGLALSPVVAAMTIFLTIVRNDKRISRFWKIMAWGTLFVAVGLLVRTGSRNACLSLLPCAYFFFQGKKLSMGKKTIFIIIGVIGALVLSSVFLKGSESVRVFAFMARIADDKFNMDDVTSGRISAYKDFLSDMKGTDFLVGRGAHIWYMGVDGKTKRLDIALSIYVTVLGYAGIVGSSLLLIYFYVFVIETRHRSTIGKVALTLFLIWASSGLGEGNGIRRGQSVCLIHGLALALCTSNVAVLHRGKWIGEQRWRVVI